MPRAPHSPLVSSILARRSNGEGQLSVAVWGGGLLVLFVLLLALFVVTQ